MNYAFSVIIGKIKKVCGCSRTDVTEVELILSSVGFSGFVVSCGALLYHTKEGWSLFDAQYYTFITLSTIGFGDFVALQNKSFTIRARIRSVFLYLSTFGTCFPIIIH